MATWRLGNLSADLSYVYAAAEQVARSLTSYAVIVTKSTVPVGTGRRIAEIVRRVRPDLDFDVASTGKSRCCFTGLLNLRRRRFPDDHQYFSL
jgi:UDP-N-acetyl-D-mannosaminuronate dehydrogenase